MQLRCTPLVPPAEWGRYSGQAQDVIIVALNAGDLLQPCWCEAAFDLELFSTSFGTRKDVHTFNAEAEDFETQALAQWVTIVKPSLRGNTRGVLYYDDCGKWCRLQALLDEQIEAGFPLSKPSKNHETIQSTQARGLRYYEWAEDVEPHIQGTPVGEGTFGQVFKGCINGEDVAIKVVRSPKGAPLKSGIEALLQEVNHCSRLQHGCDSIVQLLGLSHSVNGAVCLVYEYANAGTLRHVPENIDLPGVLRLYAQAGQGVQHMHQAGVVHADIKPDNILLHEDESGEVRALMADLGMASLLDPKTLSIAGPKGTMGFIAPERLGHRGITSAASDVFAFGATIGSLLSGKRPEYVTFRVRTVKRGDVPDTARHKAFSEIAAAIAAEVNRWTAHENVKGAIDANGPQVRKLAHLIVACCANLAANRPKMAEVVTSLQKIAKTM